MEKWQIKIDNISLGGFAPMWWKTNYPSYGNANMAGNMSNIDMTDPASITQGPALVALTNGTSTVVSTAIKGILDKAVTSDITYAIGGALLHQLSPTAVTNASPWPHTIDKGAVTGEAGEDVAHAGGALYYSYNYTGGGDIGKYDLTSTFVDDWGSTVPATGATALQAGVPHQFAQTAEFFYLTNGQYITKYDITNDIMTEQGLDFPSGSEAQSNVIAGDRLHVAVNEPDFSNTNRSKGAVYKWDRNKSSWDPDSVFGLGKVGALYVKDGTVFVFHQDVGSTDGYHLGYISGNQIKNVADYKGNTLPKFYQVTEVNGFITWYANGNVYSWGSGSTSLPTRLFGYVYHASDLSLAVPFGTLLMASSNNSYRISKASGYGTTNCYWYSILYDISQGIRGKSFINKVIVNFEALAANARTDLTLKCDLGGSSWGGVTTGRISHTGDGAVIQKTFFPKKAASNFRAEFDYTYGNSTNPVKIKNLIVEGHTL